MFRATRPYLTEPADPRLFLTKIPFFFVGDFITKVSILKKNIKMEPTLPKVFKSVALNTRFFFLTMKYYTPTNQLLGGILESAVGRSAAVESSLLLIVSNKLNSNCLLKNVC